MAGPGLDMAAAVQGSPPYHLQVSLVTRVWLELSTALREISYYTRVFSMLKAPVNAWLKHFHNKESVKTLSYTGILTR